ncbi:MAG: hypothetical protein J7496_13590 [Novosphingobium sp.]|nr:hypothetical protein [Novosphingobium sp.]MBO9603531.1 hypothetical protein [Novosphingobium sp.]
MFDLRRILLRQNRLALLLIALALCLKAAVPAGFMAEAANGSITVRICDGQSHGTGTVALPLAPGAGKHDGRTHGADGVPCAYTALSLGALGGTDPLLLEAAIAFLLLLGLAPLVSPALRRIAFAIPPLRGPPIPA